MLSEGDRLLPTVALRPPRAPRAPLGQSPTNAPSLSPAQLSCGKAAA